MAPALDEKAARDRLELSHTVISGWLAMGGPGGRHRDNMDMIRAETQILAEIARKHPGLAERAMSIGRLYGDLANRLILGMH